ncbi:MBOAT family protein [Xylogone sp. PMI_703]|nr:MBOAT family protein [Xylogone sp. PMI_703]
MARCSSWKSHQIPSRSRLGKALKRLEYEGLNQTKTGTEPQSHDIWTAADLHLQSSQKKSKNSDDSLSESTGEEDYDTLKHDPGAVVVGGKGGGFPGHIRLDKNFEDLYREAQPESFRDGTYIRDPNKTNHAPVVATNQRDQDQYVSDDTGEAPKVAIQKEQSTIFNSRRRKFRDLVFTRQFTAFDSHNTESANSLFHGFFNLFWLGTAIFVIRIAANNWRTSGSILGTNEIMSLMFHRDLLVLGLSDGVMCAATVFTLALQKVIFKGMLRWERSGWIIQSIWEILYVVSVLAWTVIREWPWTHTVFFVLHALVMLMKQHSEAFYNGYLSEAYISRNRLQQALKKLDSTSTASLSKSWDDQSGPLSTTSLTDKSHLQNEAGVRQRQSPVQNGGFTDDAVSIDALARIIESGEPANLKQVESFSQTLQDEIDALNEDLKGKCSTTRNSYPNNLSLKNHFEYVVLPTLVYELEYPRSDSISWAYVAEKIIAIFGILMIMNLVSQAFIYPVVMKTIGMKEVGMPLYERLQIFPWILLDLMGPFMMEYLLSWYLIWEAILNLLAELTYFADRGFYADWWNSVSWDQFARDWNRPVHNFLLRHVYHSSISALRVNKYVATLITFFLSACVHELVMWCIFKKLRGYLLFFQMLQLPLVQLSRTRWLKGKATLGNLIFWFGIFTGPSLLCSLYLII